MGLDTSFVPFQVLNDLGVPPRLQLLCSLSCNATKAKLVTDSTRKRQTPPPSLRKPQPEDHHFSGSHGLHKQGRRTIGVSLANDGLAPCLHPLPKQFKQHTHDRRPILEPDRPIERQKGRADQLLCPGTCRNTCNHRIFQLAGAQTTPFARANTLRNAGFANALWTQQNDQGSPTQDGRQRTSTQILRTGPRKERRSRSKGRATSSFLGFTVHKAFRRWEERSDYEHCPHASTLLNVSSQESL